MRIEKISGGNLIKSEMLDLIPNIVHGFGVRGVDVATYLDSIGIRDRFIFETNQLHGNRVHLLMYPKKCDMLKGDAFMSDYPGITCFVRTADCVPILVADQKTGAVAAIHAGWRGTAQNVVGETIRSMRKVFNTNPQDCVVAIGPSICGRCYEVGVEVIESLNRLDVGETWRVGDKKVDLKIINKALAERAGVMPVDIDMSSECTFCNNQFASYRRDKSEKERQFNFILSHPRQY